MPTNLTNARVLVTGGRGFLGGAVCRALSARGCSEVIAHGRADNDLRTERGASRAFAAARPDVVIHLAARVAGIGPNLERPAEFFRDNMSMAINVAEQARRHDVAKLVFVGSAAVYPPTAQAPFREDEIWAGPPEHSHAGYAAAKRAALTMLETYHRQFALPCACVLPINLYGPGDNFDPDTSHVVPALVRKCVEARQRGERSIPCWGSGSPVRDFLYVDDAAEGVIRAAEAIDEPTPINLGTGRETSIRELAETLVRASGLAEPGREAEAIEWDASRPDGAPRRTMDTTCARDLLAWQAETTLEDGLARTLDWFTAHARDNKEAHP